MSCKVDSDCPSGQTCKDGKCISSRIEIPLVLVVVFIVIFGAISYYIYQSNGDFIKSKSKSIFILFVFMTMLLLFISWSKYEVAPVKEDYISYGNIPFEPSYIRQQSRFNR